MTSEHGLMTLALCDKSDTAANHGSSQAAEMASLPME